MNIGCIKCGFKNIYGIKMYHTIAKGKRRINRICALKLWHWVSRKISTFIRL